MFVCVVCYLAMCKMKNGSMEKGNLHVIKGYASENFKISPYLRLVFTILESCITISFRKQSIAVQQSLELVNQPQPQERPWKTSVYQKIDVEDYPVEEMPEE